MVLTQGEEGWHYSLHCALLKKEKWADIFRRVCLGKPVSGPTVESLEEAKKKRKKKGRSQQLEYLHSRIVARISDSVRSSSCRARVLATL